MTVDHIGKHSIPGNLCLPLMEVMEFHVVGKVVTLQSRIYLISELLLE